MRNFKCFRKFFLLFALVGLPFLVAEANTFTVNNTSDTPDNNPGDGTCADGSGNCTLRSAFMEANALSGPDTIILPAGTYPLTRAGTGEDACSTGDLDVTSTIVLLGADTRTTVIDADSIDRILHILAGNSLEASGVELRRGFITGAHGGCIFNAGTLSLTDVAILNSGTQGATGGTVTAGGFGGGIFNSGALSLTKVTLAFNSATGSFGENGTLGGGGGGGGAGLGGGIYSQGAGSVSITNSTLSNNIVTGGSGGRGSRWLGSTYTGPGGFGGGLNGQGGTGNGGAGSTGGFGGGGGGASGVSGSSGSGSAGAAGGFAGGGGAGSGNAFGSGAAPGGPGGTYGGAGQNHCCDAAGGGGGGGGLGGAIFNNGSAISLLSCTVAENQAISGSGGGGHYGGSGAAGQGVGGGLFNYSGTTSIDHSIIGYNTASNTNDDLQGTFGSNIGYNLIESPGTATIGGTTTGNILNQDPRLGPLGNNGGNTNTHPLLPCNPPSPAIDAGIFAGVPAADQRDTARVNTPDIGAYENTYYFSYTGNIPDTSFCPGGSVVVDGGAGYASYSWSTGGTGQTTTISTPGQVILTVTDMSGCIAYDTLIVTQDTLPVPMLGADTSFCGPVSTTLNAGSWSGYVWQDGSTNATFAVTTAGTYSVTVTDGNGCSGSDDIVIGSNPLPVVSLPSQIQFCQGGSDTLAPGSGFNAYAWSNGDTTATLIVSASGTYIVTVTDANGCQDTAQSVVNVSNASSANIIPDSLWLCQGGTVSIVPAAGFSNFLWNGTTSADSLIANTSGTYTVEAQDGNGCIALDTTLVWDAPVQTGFLGPDQEICDAGTVTLALGSGWANPVWNDTLSGSSFVATSPGPVWVQAVDIFGCDQYDTILVNIIAPPLIQISGESELCPGDMTELIFVNHTQFDSLLWGNGSNLISITVMDTGSYSLTAWFGPCPVDTFHVITSCPSEIFIPNVFTPNNDGINDVLNLKDINLEEFEFAVFDRWGAQMFVTQNENDPWDGNTADGKQAPEGVYYYVLKYKLRKWEFTPYEKVTGNVTLMR